MLVARALKIDQIADGGMPATYETMHSAYSGCGADGDRHIGAGLGPCAIDP
jgi:hypothetical protein